MDNTCVLLVFLIFGAIYKSDSIRITRFVVPKEATFGALLELDCAYDLENDQLYDVKWFKDSDQFFRCKSDGQFQAFETEGIQLDRNQKALFGSCPVTLIILNLKSAGQYRCEVSSEAPEFKTTSKSVTLKINIINPSKRVQDEVQYKNPKDQETTTEKSGCRKRNAVPLASIFILIIVLFYVIYK